MAGPELVRGYGAEEARQEISRIILKDPRAQIDGPDGKLRKIVSVYLGCAEKKQIKDYAGNFFSQI